MRPERGHHGLRVELRILGVQLQDSPGRGLGRHVCLQVDNHLEVEAEALPHEVVQPGHPRRRELFLEHVLLGNIQLAHLFESHSGYPAAPVKGKSIHCEKRNLEIFFPIFNSVQNKHKYRYCAT